MRPLCDDKVKFMRFHAILSLQCQSERVFILEPFGT